MTRLEELTQLRLFNCKPQTSCHVLCATHSSAEGKGVLWRGTRHFGVTLFPVGARVIVNVGSSQIAMIVRLQEDAFALAPVEIQREPICSRLQEAHLLKHVGISPEVLKYTTAAPVPPKVLCASKWADFTVLKQLFEQEFVMAHRTNFYCSSQPQKWPVTIVRGRPDGW